LTLFEKHGIELISIQIPSRTLGCTEKVIYTRLFISPDGDKSMRREVFLLTETGP
jgi:hypothetical protein